MVGDGRGGKSMADLQQLFRLPRMRRTMTALLSPSTPMGAKSAVRCRTGWSVSSGDDEVGA